MPLTVAQIQAQVTSVLARHQDRTTPVMRVGIFTPEPWSGVETVSVNKQSWRIAYAPSALAAREMLLTAPSADRLILLSAVPEQLLGQDILARLNGRRLHRTNQTALLKELFQAQSLDPRVLPLARWSDLLVEHAGDEGWVPASGGHLTAEQLWNQLLKRLWKLDASSGELTDVLLWSHGADAASRLATAPREFVQAATAWLESRCGPAVRPVIGALTENSGVSPVVLGLCCGVLFADQLSVDPDALQARVRLERFVGDARIPAAAAEGWARSAASAADRLVALNGESERVNLGTTLDDLLKAIQASKFAGLSDLSALGFKQRLQVFSKSVMSLVDSDQPIDAVTLRGIRASLGAAKPGVVLERRLGKVDMVLRCAMAISAARERRIPCSLTEAMAAYRKNDGFADWARFALVGGDDSPELSELIGKLLLKIRRQREEQNRSFGKLLADWTASGSQWSDIVAIHEVLEKLVAPVAEHSPVLLVVLDGMSVPVFLELRTDLLSQGWSSVRPGNSGTTPLVLSSIPSVTQYARVSLLSGSRRSGGQAEETAGFSTNPALCAVSRNSTPALFHKAALTSSDESTVSVTVCDAIQSPTRVVGLVINAIDDLLSKGDQVSIRWTASAIRMLPSLLGLARDAGRAVILVSDHGHVAELGTTQVRGGDSDRHRPLDTPPADGEITLEGPGVHPDISGQRLVAPWSEAMRYSVRKAGYHGGASLQEMVVPIGVFFYGQRLPTGLNEVSTESPSWWSLDDSETSVAKAFVAIAAPRTSERTAPATLFEHPSNAATVSGRDFNWLDAAIASDVFASQRRLAGRTPPSAEEVRRLIVCLADRGGKLTKSALSRAMGLPDLRLPGYLSLMRRILNVDGYAVLSVHEESSTIEFNATLFKTQFGVR